MPSSPATQGGSPQKGKDLKQDLILRGTFSSGDLRLAIIEVQPAFKRRHQLKKDRLIVAEGEKIGPCAVVEIRRGEVVLGGGCRQVVLRLADSPERKKPLPKNPQSTPVAQPPKVQKAPDFGPQNPATKKKEGSPAQPPNPFKKLLEKKKTP